MQGGESRHHTGRNPLKLIITRHAKSDWDDPLLDDHDRGLNPRGQAAAERMGKWLHEQNHEPSRVLCSTARRAKLTAQGMCAEFTGTPEITYFSELYHATPDTILAQIKQADAGDLMIVGHNPGMAQFAQMICDAPPKHDRFSVYPTTATLVAEISTDTWSDLKFGAARVVNFVVPRELKTPFFT